MKILYFCNSGVHASAVAAGIHLGKLPQGPSISYRKILELDNYNKYPPDLKVGSPIFMGVDSDNNEIYTFPVEKEKILIPKMIRSLMRIFKIPKDEILLVDMTKYSTPVFRIGYFLSKTLSQRSLGGFLIAYSFRQSYSDFLEQVARVKEEVQFVKKY